MSTVTNLSMLKLILIESVLTVELDFGYGVKPMMQGNCLSPLSFITEVYGGLFMRCVYKILPANVSFFFHLAS